MSNDLNRVTLVGNAGKDPVVSGEGKKPFAAVSLATTEEYKKGEEKATETQWHNLVFYGTLAEQVKQNVKKGSRLSVEGKLRYHKWQDKDGNARLATQIVAQTMKSENGQANQTANT